MINSGELLFVKSVKDGIPNRDPLNDSDARRIFSEDDGRISLSDVSTKRDVRDFVIDAYPDGGEQQRYHIFVQQIVNEKGNLLGRGSLAENIAKKTGKEKIAKNDMKNVLIEHCFDVRTFGIVYSVKPKFNLTGPVQFGWSHSLHPVMTKYVQGTVVMPSKDSSVNDDTTSDDTTKEEGGKTQGTIWTSYILPFAVFAMPAVINANIAKKTGMTLDDQELLLKGLWKGTQNRQARGRGNQQPLLMVHVEYKDPFFRIGYLEDYIKMLPEMDKWKENIPPTSIKEIKLDITMLTDILTKNQHEIAQCRYWKNPMVSLEGEMFGEERSF